jgi:hypothetical protein
VVEQIDKNHGGDGHSDQVLGLEKKKEKQKAQDKGISGRSFLIW